ncbi:phage/plasmid primase, P4 family [Sphingomonas corticis]|uniref:SF3 helicase domain-containing protein n=1 Tax=Sphingomonas corticis TaxID=2722791 RepID=A0ABX1CSF1_9SPHN|nr:phage/plasmid primase, P4 family [Sphingomonas corticis]NJR80439.1 hypothetical protein [Sphingomonas corticis]
MRVPTTTLPSAMGQAALQYARRGWPVFPVRERDETVRIGGAGGEERTFKAKAPYTGKGLKDATTHEPTIEAWWRQHPNALIGLPTGVNGCFVLDFDPRVEEDCDPETGEVIGTREWTLEQLKADLEDQMGVPLPRSLTAITQSGGVHVYFRQPDGEPIRNRGNLPAHVDVRGLGGYVIAPPSILPDTGKSYRWMRDRGDWRDDADIAEAPAELVTILRSRKVRPAASPAAMPAERRQVPASSAGHVDDAVRKYALSALDGECRAIRTAGSGRRNAQLNESAFKVATLVAAGALDAGVARASVEAAARDNPGRDDDGQLMLTVASGWTAGSEQPRDLGEIAAAARSRADRRPAAPGRPAPRAERRNDASFRVGRVDGVQVLDEAGWARARKVAQAWLARRAENVDPTKEAITRLAYGVGRRIAAELLDEHDAKQALWDVYEGIADVQHADVDRAIEDGINRGFDLAPIALTMKCLGYPLTDFGIAERFRDRYGDDFRFTTGKGWLGWDGRRWKVLDQDEKTPPAEVIAAVFETVRAIQDEARFIADTKVKWSLVRDGKEQRLDLDDEDNPHGLDRWIAKGKGWELLSTKVSVFGRQSETTGKPAAVALLARRWLTVPIERFDHDKYAFNVANGTLRFRTEEGPDGAREGAVTLSPHNRADMLTKLSPVTYDPGVASPRYDAMFGWAQPDASMRRYLHQLGGYALTGDAGEQKLWFWYGRGRNGKGTTLDVWQHVVGDYADSIPIGSFLDQGIKKRGDQASPDLAKLAGVRMLRSSEPGRNEKLDTGLIKLVTGGDPLPVRMLHRGFFNLQPLFKLIIMGNTKFDIPDTDDGIWSRMKLIPWLRNIEKPEPGVANWPEKDPNLPAKIIAEEASGVLNRLVAGLLDYLSNGLVEPKSVTEATMAYRDASDPLARFLRLCVVADADTRVQSSKLHEVFVAWCKAAGEREWSNKGFSNAMAEKGYQKKASDGMQWLGIRLVKEVHDFVDHDGKPRSLSDEPVLSDNRTMVDDNGWPPPDDFGDVPP